MNTRSPVNDFRNALVFFFVFGLGFSALAAYLTVSSYRFVDSAVHAEGVVVAIKKGTRGKTWPIVAFKTASGVRVQFQSNVPNRWFMVIGTHVGVLYDERGPSSPRIDSFNDLWGMPFLFGLMGLFSLGLGFAAPRLRARRSPLEKPHSSISSSE